MNDELDPQIEAAVTQTYAAHARRIGQPAGRLDDVLRRVRRRRHKRRVVAGTTSVAMVAAGVLGIAALGRMGSEAPARGAGEPLPTLAGNGEGWFVCSGAIERDGVVLYDWCELETPYANPAWSCSGAVDDPALDGDDRPRFEHCDAVGEAYPQTDVCVPVTVVPTTTMPGEPFQPTPTTSVEELCATPPTTNTTSIAPPSTVPLPGEPAGAPWTVPPSALPTTTPTPCNTPCGVPAGIEQIYIVVPGDTLYAIATQFGITVDVLLAYNEWESDHILLVDEQVKLPPEALLAADVCTHRIVEGDNPTNVADRYDTAVEGLQQLNFGSSDYDQFLLGSLILVPYTPGVC